MFDVATRTKQVLVSESQPHKKALRRRKYKRQHIKVEATLYLYLQNGILFDEGKCTIQDLSPDGALVTSIELKNESFPIVPFSLKFQINQGEFEGLSATGDPIRFINNGQLGMGVRFTEFAMEVK